MRASIAFVAFVAALPGRAIADPSPEAARAYRDGQAAFDRQSYDAAIEAWQRSYELSHAPGLLYNLGQAYRLRAAAGDCTRARSAYESFVDLTGPSPQGTLANGYLAQLGPCASSATATVGTTPATSMPVTRDRGIAMAALGAAGIGLVATGLLLGHHAATLGDEVTSACSTDCDWSAERGKDAAGRRDAALGWTFDAIGGLALVGDAVWYYLGRDHGSRTSPLEMRADAHAATISWRQRW